MSHDKRKKQEMSEPVAGNDALFTYQNILALAGLGIGAAALFYEFRPKKAVEAEPQHVVINTPVTQLESFD